MAFLNSVFLYAYNTSLSSDRACAWVRPAPNSRPLLSYSDAHALEEIRLAGYYDAFAGS